MILAIGDSNLYPACTVSEQAPDPTNMAAVFSDLMGQPFDCWAMNGASNYWIESHIEYFLADASWPRDTMLFVGWTSVEREEWPWMNKTVAICGGPDFGKPGPIKARYEQWRGGLNGRYVREKTLFWHDRIHAMHRRLLDRGVPHLFWSTYDNFRGMHEHAYWGRNYYKPYDQTGYMKSFFESNGIPAYTHDPFHYSPAAHRAWAQELFDHTQVSQS